MLAWDSKGAKDERSGKEANGHTRGRGIMRVRTDINLPMGKAVYSNRHALKYVATERSATLREVPVPTLRDRLLAAGLVRTYKLLT
jgi:hypothetical protein